MPPTNQQPSSRLRLQAGHWSDPGRQRQENEDSYGISASQPGGRLAQRGAWQIAPEQQLAERGHLFVVADGVGGHNAGAVASALATQVILREYYSGPFAEPRAGLARAIDAANQAIMAQSGSGDAALSDMGTTVVAAVVREYEATVAHVGDSRCYLVNQTGVQQLTQDHTWVSDQLQAGVLTEEEVQRHPYRHVLSRTLGRSDAAPDVLSLRLQAGDRLVLCSDGLSNLVAPQEIQGVVLRYAPQVAAEQLVALANQRGGPDNITAVVMQVDETAAGSAGALAGVSAWLASLPRLWLAAGVLGFAVMACLVLFAIDGIVGTVQGPTPTPTKTPTPEVVPTETLVVPSATLAPADPASTPSAPTTPEQTLRPIYHIVQEGDTLSGLAAEYGVDEADIATANGIVNRQLIFVGQQLQIPIPTQASPSQPSEGP